LFDEDCSAEETENKLEYTTAYNTFCDMFEGHIERIIEEVRPGTSGEDFFNALKS